ncbi:MAG: glycylpeptide N-tetradecanoyltransferase [Alyxoria varia]|nr:MAG: glycylpeptide N-tetradecanoyltransferase [Alyxoria varia]
MTSQQEGGESSITSHKFWQTQPVPHYEQAKESQEGPIEPEDPEKVPKEPSPLIDGFEWVTVDLDDQKEIDDVYQLLYHNYVEDDEAMFRFKYSHSFFNWALKAPGWRKDWHIGIRASTSRKLVAFISGVPIVLRVRENKVKCSEVNFLCIHKKLRGKRLAPILIREVTRRCHLVGIWQAIYTAGVMLPTPVSTCRYFHRSLDWEKLFECGFSPLPPGSTRQRQIIRYKLPEHPQTPGVRPMKKEDVGAVQDLLQRYLARSQIAQDFTNEEVEHWLLNEDAKSPEKVVYSYVVEAGGKITDFFSFYTLDSTVIGNKKHDTIRAAYLFYYATETVFQGKGKDLSALRKRLNELVHDALICAKKVNFDVVNALTLLDNPLFLQEQKFGPGDGKLHYYLYNYRTGPIPGGLNDKLALDEKRMTGTAWKVIGIVAMIFDFNNFAASFVHFLQADVDSRTLRATGGDRQKKKEKNEKKKSKNSAKPAKPVDHTATTINPLGKETVNSDPTKKRKRTNQTDGEDVSKNSKKSKKSKISAELDGATVAASVYGNVAIPEPKRREVSPHLDAEKSLKKTRKKDKKRGKKSVLAGDVTGTSLIVEGTTTAESKKRKGSQPDEKDCKQKKPKKEKKSKTSVKAGETTAHTSNVNDTTAIENMRKREGSQFEEGNPQKKKKRKDNDKKTERPGNAGDATAAASTVVDTNAEAAERKRSLPDPEEEKEETSASLEEMMPPSAISNFQSTQASEGVDGNSLKHDRQSNKYHQKRNNVSFSRIPADIKVDERFASNDYRPYDYAHHAYRDLSVTKGKGFTKEKNKKKRGQSFRGGKIDIAGGRSIKFDD